MGVGATPPDGRGSGIQAIVISSNKYFTCFDDRYYEAQQRAGSCERSGRERELDTEEDRLGAVGGAAHGCELYTEDDLLGALSGAAGGCELYTEEDRPGALSGAAGSDGR